MPTQPALKRQKLSFFATIRARNGGSPDSFLTPSSSSPPTNDDGSDTEEEDNTKLEEEYLNKMTDDTDRPKQTVFGEGVEVWTSHGGTVYADVNDKIKRAQREKEIWSAEARSKVSVGSKRKFEEIKVKAEKKPLVMPEESVDGGEGGEFIPILTPPPPAYPTTTIAYPTRSPTATQFHRGSAGIDPLGAHNRPIAPLPSRARIVQDHHQCSQGPEGTAQHLRTLHVLGARELADGKQRPISPLLSPAPVVVSARPNRIVSGSFGSFEVRRPSRFDERVYRLGPGGKEGKENEIEERKEVEKGKLDPFKGRPWLR